MIEIGTPCCLPLGFGRIDRQPALLGITLQHPPVHLTASPASQLSITGGRADLAHRQAQHITRHHALSKAAQIEIELAIPSQMGLNSDTLIGLSIARALAWANGRPLDDLPALTAGLQLGPTAGLATCSFQQGGILAVTADNHNGELPQVLRRHELAHPQNQAWAFVLVLPRVPAGTPEMLEKECMTQVIQAAKTTEDDTGLLADKLWAALEDDDIDTFAAHLTTLQKQNTGPLQAAGLPGLTKNEQSILAVMRQHGALAAGRSLSGLALYGLVRGAKATQTLRTALRKHIGYTGGITQATITDNTGSRHTIQPATP